MNSPPEIAKAYCEAGVKKINTPLLKVFILGIYAGIYIASGGVCASIVSYQVIGGLGRLLSGAVFPIGLMLVMCAGAELFTGNCLLIIPFLCKRISILDMLLSWLIVYVGNFIGGLFIALMVVYGHIFDLYEKKLAASAVSTAIGKTTLSFGDAFIKGMLCNYFVCLAVWVAFGAKDLHSKILGLWTPVLLFVVCGYEHSVANMYYIPAGLFASYEYDIDRPKLNWGRYFYKNLIPVTLGNIVGGSGLVGFVYWFIYLCNQENILKQNSDLSQSCDTKRYETEDNTIISKIPK